MPIRMVGGAAANPRAVIMADDLIDRGWSAERAPVDWQNLTTDFGVAGEGRCKFPVFEGHGNHDWNPSLFVHGKIPERNLARLKLELHPTCLRQWLSLLVELGWHRLW